MSAQPAEYPHTELDGQEAVIIPLAKLNRLEAIERHATPEEIAAAEAEAAEIESVLAEYREWVAGGRKGGASQEEMERLFAEADR
jgi:hypothetical protein